MKKSSVLTLITLLLTVSVLSFQACRKADEGNGPTPVAPAATPTARAFKMGFTPWPWDATQAAVDDTWTKILNAGDIVSLHFEEGVPWNEALSGAAFPASFQAELGDRLKRVSGAQKLAFLSVNALDNSRSSLAPFRGTTLNEPLTPPWNSYAFNDPAVKTAYLNYSKRMIDFFTPQYVLTGIEVNVLRSKVGQTGWNQFKELQCSVYNGLKAAGVNQPIGVSLIAPAFYHPELYATQYVYAEQVQVLRDLEPCVDFIAWSVHPFMSGLFAEIFPDDYFSVILNLTSKPQAISESSYPAQTWSASGMVFRGTPEKQDNFVRAMLTQARQKSLLFAIWFTVQDYDALWARPVASGGLGSSVEGETWRDTGLYDENGDPRAGYKTWFQEFAK